MTNKLEKLFISLGYTSEQARSIRTSYPANGLKDETLYTNVKKVYYALEELKYTNKDIIYITVAQPAIYCFTVETILNKYDNL